MDDLISRKALLAEYDRVHIGEPGKARKLIEDAPAVQQWISVKDRLPEHGEVVLVYTKYKDIFEVQWDSVSGIWLGERFDVPNKIVTNWMPRPEPPKGE